MTITKKEQFTIINKFVSLLKHRTPRWRSRGVSILEHVSHSYGHNKTHQAIPHLVKLYRTERSNRVRRSLVSAIQSIEDHAFWKKLTGNSYGIAMILNGEHKVKEDYIHFYLSLLHSAMPISPPHTFHFQKLQNDGSPDNKKITVSVSKKLKPVWNKYQGEITFTSSELKLTQGLWRVTVDGTHNSKVWHSEPFEINILNKDAIKK